MHDRSAARFGHIDVTSTDASIVARNGITPGRVDDRPSHSAAELKPRGMQEDGWLEGWKYASGETIQILHDDYEDLHLTVP